MIIEAWEKYYWGYAGRLHEHLECCPLCMKGDFCERSKIIWKSIESFNKQCFKDNGRIYDFGLGQWFPFAVAKEELYEQNESPNQDSEG